VPKKLNWKKNKKTLSELVALRSAYFQQDGENLDQKRTMIKKIL
jgi:hypothetical protein